ncbi:MAG: insulinase family protein [Gemmatimonadota bacterium]|nr:MAG: insulinase family protein [Gemmatimonadota bacterium]
MLSEHVPGVRSVATGIWLRWGGSHDRPQRMGSAHLLEHMIFKGTSRRSARQIALEIEGIGGSLDAYTSREHTGCYARVLDEHLPIAVDVLTDLVFCPVLRENDLEVERNVILEEIAGVEDTPEDLVFDLHARCLWGDHPYGNPVLGTAETVGAITKADLHELWRTAYQPSTCVVAAAGNLRHEEFLELVTRQFPANVSGGTVPTVPQPPEMRPLEHTVDRGSSQVHICLGATTFSRSDPRRYGAILVSTTLGAGMSSRLFQRVREERGLAYTVYSYQSFYARGGLSGIYMATRPDTANAAIAEVRSELAELCETGLSPDELESVKNQTKGQVLLSLESTSARLQRLAGVALYDEPYQTLNDICARIDAVTTAEVADLCREYYAPDRQVLVRLGPGPREGTPRPGGHEGASQSDARGP